MDEAGWLDDAVDTLGDVASWFNAFILWFILLGASVAAVGLVLGSGVALVWWVYLES